MAKLVIFPYNRKSRSYKELNKALGSEFPAPSTFQAYVTDSMGEIRQNRKVDLLINWGSGNIPNWARLSAKTILNTSGAVNACRNKIKFFNAVKEKARVPEYTEDFETAMNWVREGKLVMGRRATGSCGTDIVFYEDDPGQFQTSEFWVQYKKKKHEFRVHLFRGEVISLQQKAVRTTDADGQPIPSGTINFRIRNHRNGFIFKRNDISVPQDVIEQAKLAFGQISGLDFGAVDVIYNQYEDRAYVLEINTAPGLEGTTLEDYAKVFRSL